MAIYYVTVYHSLAHYATGADTVFEYFLCVEKKHISKSKTAQ